MALEDIRVVYGNENGEIIIEKESGEAHRLIDVYIDVSDITFWAYMDVKVGTKGIIRIPLRTFNYNLFTKPEGGFNKMSVFGFIRKILGEDVYVEADEDEDIIMKVCYGQNNPIDIRGKSVAVYEVIEAGIDKTKLLHSGCDEYLIMPDIYHIATVSGDNASIDTTVSLDSVSQMDGLPMVKDGYVVPAGTKFVLKTIIADGYFESSGTKKYEKNILHIKKDTFELFSPIKMYGIHLEDSVGNTTVPRQNIAAFDLGRQNWLDCQDFVFEEGTEIGLEAEIKGSGTGTGIVTSIFSRVVMVMLKTKM